jgi:glycosyltransferase involved in cell wall biosynthesis
VGAMFKNESHSMKEWLDHYIYHGVEHFYLIDDGSTDDYIAILQDYIDRGVVSLFVANEGYYLGRQRNLYNRYILPHIKETRWLLMVDLDEYVWSVQNIRLDCVLTGFEQFGQIQIQESLFGSNGYENQPKHILPSFTKRCNEYRDTYKYFVNSAFDFYSLNVHYADFTDRSYMTNGSVFIIAYDYIFLLNHYKCQSREFWNNVKCTRGDSDNYTVRREECFMHFDMNDVDDSRLYKQNECLYEAS